MLEAGAARVAFAGTPAFASNILAQLLAAGVRPVLVLTQPDRPAGRGRHLIASPVKLLASNHQLPIAQPASLKTASERAVLTTCRPQLLIVAAYGLILPRVVLSIPAQGCVNVHASLLPRWRGAAPIERAIMAGDTHTGVSLMRMDTGLDTGPVIATAHCLIGPTDTGGELEVALALSGGRLLLDWLERLLAGQAAAQPQDATLATYANKLTRADALIDWQCDAARIAAQVRALTGRLSAETGIAGDRIQVLAAAVTHTPLADGQAGEIVSAGSEGIVVRCGRSALLIHRLRVTSRGKGSALTAREACNGYGSLFRCGQVFNTGQAVHGPN